MMRKTEVVVAGVDMEVTFEYEAANYGEPLYYGPLIDIVALYCGDVDLVSVINEETFADIIQQIEDQHNNQEEII